MRKFLLVLILFVGCFIKLFAQNGGVNNSGLPDFKMMLSNGTFYTASQLPQSKPVILVYFAPDCGHCQVLIKDLFKRENELKQAQIVMVTFKPVHEVAQFEKNYHTDKYKNIIVGTEGTTFFLRNYYKMSNTPFTVLYDKHHNLVHAYRKDTSVDDLVKRVKGLG